MKTPGPKRQMVIYLSLYAGRIIQSLRTNLYRLMSDPEKMNNPGQAKATAQNLLFSHQRLVRDHPGRRFCVATCPVTPLGT